VTSISDWTQFFVAILGAAAALAGLVFVGLALNMNHILSYPLLPNRALQAVTVLVGIVFAAILLLIPGQPTWVLGAEVLVFGVTLWAFLTRLTVRSHRIAKPDQNRYVTQEAIEGQAASVFYIAAGAAILLYGSVGIYLVVPSVLASFFNGIVDAWVLLVEINR
jgi:hypothetical protein